MKRGTCLKTPHQLPLNVTFVLIIDDVDLQVARIRELLPAIRLLSRHHSVWFLVAGDSKHMLDMLHADFLGQQLKLVGKDVSPTIHIGWINKPSGPPRWQARRFRKSLGSGTSSACNRCQRRSFCGFPGTQSESMQTFLNEWDAQSSER